MQVQQKHLFLSTCDSPQKIHDPSAGCDPGILVCSWSSSHIRWGQAFRLRHLSTGHYLALSEDRGLVLQDREKSDTTATAFCFRPSKVRSSSLR